MDEVLRLVLQTQSWYIGYLGFLRKIGLVANGRHIALYYYFTTQKVVSLLLWGCIHARWTSAKLFTETLILRALLTFICVAFWPIIQVIYFSIII